MANKRLAPAKEPEQRSKRARGELAWRRPLAAASAGLSRSRDAWRSARLRWRVASLRRQVAREPRNRAALAALGAALEASGSAAGAIDCYLGLSRLFRDARDADQLSYLVRKLEHLGCDDLARLHRDLARLYAETGRHEEAARSCRRVVEAYLAEGQVKAASGYLGQLPPLGRTDASTRAELVSLVERAAPGAPGAPAPEREREPERIFLSGALGRISAFDVVQIVESNGLTGRLSVDVPGSRATGALFFDNGRIVAARFGSLSGRAGARDLLRLTAAAFRVELDDGAPPDEFGATTNTGLLLDLLREIDEEESEDEPLPPARYVTSPLVEGA